MRFGAGVGERGAGPIAIVLVASAVRRETAAWFAWTMGPSRSRAARSQRPRRCVSAPVAFARPTSHVATAHALRRMLRTTVRATWLACQVLWVTRGTRAIACCSMLGVAWYVARCGTPDGARGAARCVPNGAGTVRCALCGVLRVCAARVGEGRAFAVGRAAVRCTRAQYSGGVLFMAKGIALFDAVTISDTEGVRAARGGDASRAGCAVDGVSADGVRGPIAIGVAAPAVRRPAAAA